MSLVSCFVGNVQWGIRASDAEYKAQVIGEEIYEMTQAIAGLTEEITGVETGKTDMQGQLSYLYSILSSQGLDPQTRQDIINQIYAMQAEQNQQNQSKAELNQIKNQYHQREKELQKQLKAVEMEVKLASEQGESFKKMQDGAIKRLTVNV
ncbi:MAG: hypothetical protein A2Y25_06290 [Candidatus Melainabacteria bacterium GWF2_37_15]|nr:MAG: hypothetical protein A2Y25_06290 [Candidatus Melainabacteria bacterium GWF2_37_15]